jgi:hypothetical protein
VAVILPLDAERQADQECNRNPKKEVEVTGERQV